MNAGGESGSTRLAEDACREADVTQVHLTRTIEIVHPNANRIRRALSRHWSDLVGLSRTESER